MTFEIALVLGILAISLVLFISEVIRMDLVALLVLGTLAIGLPEIVTADKAFAGFSNSAVITVWAMFILSEGLTRTGIADIIGRQVMRIGGRREFSLIVVIMITGAVLSAFMNNIGVAALMLPVVIEVARRTRIAPSRLLMPLAYSTLLGGLMTLIGTPPNLLIAESLAIGGYEPFGLFDFTPIGGAVMVVGVLFVALGGRLLLPRMKVARDKHVSQRSLRARYKLQERTFMLRVPTDSILVGKTLAESRIGTSTGLIILSIFRQGRSETLPGRQTVIRGGDGLLVQGRVDQFRELRRWSDLVIEREAPVLKSMVAAKIGYAIVTISDSSPVVSELVRHAAFRSRFDVSVVGILRRGSYRLTNLAYVPLKAGDQVLVQGETGAIEELEKYSDFATVDILNEERLAAEYHADERMFVVRLPKASGLVGATLAKSRLAEVFDFRVVATFRDGELTVMPRGDEVLDGGDLLLLEGQHSDLDVLRGLQELEIDTKVSSNVAPFESERLTLMDATLDPRSALAGRTVGELNFRERYGIELAGIWREGETVGTDIADERLQIGDALLLLGPRDRLQLLSTDSDFLILTPLGQEPPDTRRAPLAAAIMLGVVLTVMMGYAPISIAAVIGGSIMVLTGCLNMEQAYRAIDWRAIFLIAGMLPLGTAMQETGAAEYLATQVMDLLGDAGPWPVIMGLYILTAMATMIIPTAALVVLMSPIVLSAMGDLGVDPYPAMMAVAMAASASFTSPISHPANILVMGPGGYRFVDYLKVGVPLTIVVFITVMVLLPILWPLVPV
ncbi:MAG: SLC13 family permease [Gammaproteobacteria bacterium]|nr:SLC13 family permease [Gammaproteobacteria bacterium]NNF49330.1 SLC13 family permease [Woeseiaceae bacterium]MBT8094915.1 SLC13 family permease [Gammaproteobacteria bacterium]MBT8104517.1 SLC13 family permease [Gammaproteobacteria bacterium]NNK24531.1 SLC13 family permease [Woeseiaceae bacterium]